jgi:hypothetical protein
MREALAAGLLCCSVLSSVAAAEPVTAAAAPVLRPPAVPLVAHDPFFSCWSMADHLYDEYPKHWTGRIFGMAGMIRVDNRAQRFMGLPAGVDAVVQKSVTVHATQTVYTFDCGPVDLTVRFISPLLPDDLKLLARPASYITYSAVSKDGREYEVQVYFDASGEWAVNNTDQRVTWDRMEVPGLHVMSIGTVDQKVLGSKGDDHRIDWGRFMVAAPAGESKVCIGDDASARRRFADRGTTLESDDTDKPRAVRDRWPVLSVVFDMGKVGATPVERYMVLAYDDVESIQYLGKNLKGWWRGGEQVSSAELVAMAAKEYGAVRGRCDAFDAVLRADAVKAGGAKYAALCEMLYRHSISAHKLVASEKGQPYFFSKENFSNGCIATVDVTFPSAALYLAYSPALLKGMCDPIFEYCDRGRWKFPFAPHDLGQYPLANGQVYGGGEQTEADQMPVEESGNMLILAAGICVREGSGAYAKQHWKHLTTWKDYLVKHGLDPAHQLCTDDFAGHLARNANLSIKAILGIGAYAKMAEMMGESAVAAEHYAIARDYARKWMVLADAGDHYVLAFGKPETWSMKYNLVWDTMLGLNIFPPEVAQRELAYYKTKMNTYGLPLDNRATYTKGEYLCMIATMHPNRADADVLVERLYRYASETSSRVPMSDWHDTVSGKMHGFQARSVVGGCFMQVLRDKMAGGGR